MGFIRRQEEQLVVRLLVWRCQKMNVRVPPASELEHQASRLVDEAHRIASRTGRNVVSIIKEMIDDLKK
jgi:hypothetical protein